VSAAGPSVGRRRRRALRDAYRFGADAGTTLGRKRPGYGMKPTYQVSSSSWSLISLSPMWERTPPVSFSSTTKIGVGAETDAHLLIFERYVL
jgi:hypothetical protein